MDGTGGGSGIECGRESERKGMYLEQVGTVKGTGGGLSETIPLAVHVPQGRSIYPRLGGRFL